LIVVMVIWVKLTQGTGRGTCWWSIYIFIIILINIFFRLLITSVLDIFFDKFYSFCCLSYSNLFDDLIVIFMIYSFIKVLLMSSLNELVWPTQFFNRRHNIGFQVFKFRTYTEVILKLKSSNSFIFLNNYIFLNYFLF